MKNKKASSKYLAPVVLGIAFLILLICFVYPSLRSYFCPRINMELIIEAGSDLPDAEAFLAFDEKATISYAEPLTISNTVPGLYTVDLICNEKPKTASLRIIDTHAPTGTTQDITVYNPTTVQPEDFITSISDCTSVSVDFVSAPDLTLEGTQAVSIQLTDAGNNTAVLSATLTIIFDSEAPIIEGTRNIVIYQGDTVSYRKGITVTDNLDPAPELKIDSSQVNLSAPGEYEVVYEATDDAGNTTRIPATVTVFEKQASYVELDVIYEAIDGLLDEIITEGMTDREKVEAVFWWIRLHTNYVNHSDKSDWIQAAYQMYIGRHGDCFSYFALNKLMLDRLGIPNIDVVKIPNWANDGHHYWSLVSIDGGQTYYHVDITPRADITYLLLVTDQFLDYYSKQNYNSHNRDLSLYPPTPETAP